jgi:hypothetical protein
MLINNTCHFKKNKNCVLLIHIYNLKSIKILPRLNKNPGSATAFWYNLELDVGEMA